MCEHAHKWTEYLPDALGYFEKREDGERAYFRGMVLTCADQPCEIFLFVPHDPQLAESECVLEAHVEEKRVAA